ncbi:ankyrin repeat-containing domain protein [Tricladium varicosporioides]|nr:ankyrin repeat-containing domain protein [Hymenoscyphus varicosporioides]
MPLHHASARGHVEVVRFLLEKGAELELKDTAYGQTPLLWAVEKGHEATVQLLLEKSANTEIKNRGGCNSLQLAVFKGYRGVEQLLVRYSVSEPEDFYGFQRLFL